jgi:hypothetical protein
MGKHRGGGWAGWLQDRRRQVEGRIRKMSIHFCFKTVIVAVQRARSNDECDPSMLSPNRHKSEETTFQATLRLLSDIQIIF